MKSVLRALLALLLLIAALGTGSAVAPQADDARTDHQKTVDFWTVDKVKQAKPRDFVFDPSAGRFIPAAKGGTPGRPGGGGGGGGGDGDSTTVTGAHWTGGGVIAESTGKVLFALGGDYWVCSASVVTDGDANDGRAVAVTAAHCVYENEGDGEFASEWVYIPEYEAVAKDLHILNDNTQVCSEAPHGCFTASALVVHDGFASAGGFNGTAIQYDFAFAVLNGNVDADLGQQNIDFNAVAKGTTTFAFGYPHDFASFNHDLTYCAGGLNFDNRLFKLTYKLKCDMTGGASGGPWFSSFDEAAGTGTVMSVNSYGYAGGGAMHGPKFNTNTQAVYQAALATTGSCVAPDGC
jgi:V8-like Glu-specific endopeptidase